MAELNFKSFQGINNVLEPHRISARELTEALNVLIDDSGAMARREGFTRKNSTATHSAHSASDEFSLVRQGDGLYRLDPDYGLRELLTGFGDRQLVYDTIAHHTYFSDGLMTYRTDGLVTTPAGVQPPDQQPDATNLDYGQLTPGKYQYAATFETEDGRESPTGTSGAITVTGSGIQFVDIRLSLESQVVRIHIYVSKPNGKKLYRALTLDPDVTSATYTGGRQGRELTTQLMLPTPPADVLAHHNAMLLIGQGRYLRFSPPYQHHLVKHAAFVAMTSDIKVIASFKDGFWVATDKQIGFIAGDAPTGEWVPKRKHGAFKGTLAYMDADTAFVCTPEGILQLGPGGFHKNLTDKRYHPSEVSSAIFVPANILEGKTARYLVC